MLPLSEFRKARSVGFPIGLVQSEMTRCSILDGGDRWGLGRLRDGLDGFSGVDVHRSHSCTGESDRFVFLGRPFSTGRASDLIYAATLAVSPLHLSRLSALASLFLRPSPSSFLQSHLCFHFSAPISTPHWCALSSGRRWVSNSTAYIWGGMVNAKDRPLVLLSFFIIASSSSSLFFLVLFG